MHIQVGLYFVLAMLAAALAVGSVLVSILFRVVVPTNDVHIVQRAKSTVSYGKDQPGGNVYMQWPAWLPRIGVRVTKFPVSVFSVALKDYAAYDQARVPFIIHILAFFRITHPDMAAQRVSDVNELHEQLEGILQGVVRTILATSKLDGILEGRSEFGAKFTTEVDTNLREWGVQSVKQIELMDIRDADGSQVIQNIMAKQKSEIEKESRIKVAENMKAAKEAEIAANQSVSIQAQVAEEAIGKRAAEKAQAVGIATQIAEQQIKEQEKETATKEMAVQQIKQVRQAEIEKDVQVVNANRDREVQVVAANRDKEVQIIRSEAIQRQQVIEAEGTKQRQVLEADGKKQSTQLESEGTLTQQLNNAKGIQAEGEARGAADTAVNLATIAPQISLAKEIGENQGYQKYLVDIRIVEKDQAIGVAQAGALEHAEVKVIANTGQAIDGVKSVMDLFTTKGGTQLAGMVEAIAQSPAGAAMLKKFNGNGEART